jgi:predicted nucleotidyltransferase
MDTGLIVSILRANVPTLELAYLFGSQFAGTATDNSDVDVAIRAGSRLSFDERVRIAGALSDGLKKEVDLVDLWDANDTVKMQVIDKGGLLHAASPQRVAEFEMYALSDYIRLNELRRGILEDFYSGGS